MFKSAYLVLVFIFALTPSFLIAETENLSFFSVDGNALLADQNKTSQETANLILSLLDRQKNDKECGNWCGCKSSTDDWK